MESVYGSSFGSFLRPEYVLETLRQGRKLTALSREADKTFIVFAVPASIPMADGSESRGVLQAVPVEAFPAMMNLEGNDAVAFFHVIRANGEYIIRNSEALEADYFENLMKHATPGDMTKEEALKKLKDSIAMRAECVLDVTYENAQAGAPQRRSVLCSPIPESGWYLVTVMPFGSFDTMVASIGGVRTKSIWLALAILVAGLLAVSAFFFRATRRQMPPGSSPHP